MLNLRSNRFLLRFDFQSFEGTIRKPFEDVAKLIRGTFQTGLEVTLTKSLISTAQVQGIALQRY